VACVWVMAVKYARGEWPLLSVSFLA